MTSFHRLENRALQGRRWSTGGLFLSGSSLQTDTTVNPFSRCSANWTSLVRCLVRDFSSPAPLHERVTVELAAIPIVINCRTERDDRTEQPIDALACHLTPGTFYWRRMANNPLRRPLTTDSPTPMHLSARNDRISTAHFTLSVFPFYYVPFVSTFMYVCVCVCVRGTYFFLQKK